MSPSRPTPRRASAAGAFWSGYDDTAREAIRLAAGVLGVLPDGSEPFDDDPALDDAAGVEVHGIPHAETVESNGEPDAADAATRRGSTS